MKKIIVLFLVFANYGFVNAKVQTKKSVTVDQVFISVNEELLEHCLSNLVDDEGTFESCVVFEVSSNQKILKDNGFIGALQFIALWSESVCRDIGGPLRLRQEPKKGIKFFTENRACIIKMKQALRENSFQSAENSSLYVLTNN